MAKFSKGDKVESVKTGAKGVVDEVYGEEKYAVLFDGSTNPDRVEGFQIKAANGCARNAKFKEGDRVKIVSGGSLSGKTGRVARISSDSIGVYADVIMDDNGREEQVPIDVLHIANSAPLASTNAVVQNAINARRARNGDILDRSFVKQKASSIYNDLDDLLDYVRRAAKNESNIRIESSIANSMNALRGII